MKSFKSKNDKSKKILNITQASKQKQFYQKEPEIKQEQDLLNHEITFKQKNILKDIDQNIQQFNRIQNFSLKIEEQQNLNTNNDKNKIYMKKEISKRQNNLRQKTDENDLNDNLEFKYHKLLDILKGNDYTNKLGYYQYKIDYMIMVASKLNISVFDLMKLIPTKYLSYIFRDYQQQENMFINLVLSSNNGLSQPNIIFEDIIINIGENIDQNYEYYKAHSNQKEQMAYCFNDNCNEKDISPQESLHKFFRKYIIPNVLYHLIDFDEDIIQQMDQIIGKQEDQKTNKYQNQIFCMDQCQQVKSLSQNSESNIQQKYYTQNLQHIFNSIGYTSSFQDFLNSMKFFIEKVYRKNRDKSNIIFEYLKNLRNNEQNKFKYTFEYDSIKKNKSILQYLAMSGIKRLLFYYSQDKKVLFNNLDEYLFNFKKKDIFLSYYQKYISTDLNAQYVDETNRLSKSYDLIYNISQNIDEYCTALQKSKTLVCSLRYSILIIRLQMPIIEFANQISQTETICYLQASLCWRVVKYIIFIHDGNISYVALTFLNKLFDKIFSQNSFLHQYLEYFLQLLFGFLFFFRSREDYFMNKSKEIATQLIQKLLNMQNQSILQYPSFESSKDKKQISKQISYKKLNSYENLKYYWFLNYNYSPIDELVQKIFEHVEPLDLYQKYSYIVNELKQIQIQPSIDEKLLLILLYLKNLLLQEQQYKTQNGIMFNDINQDLNQENLQNILWQNKITIYQYLLDLIKLEDQKKILCKNNFTLNILIKLKQELIVDCLGLIGQIDENLIEQNYCFEDILPFNITLTNIKDKIKEFLDQNIFNTDISLVSLCQCKEYFDDQLSGKRVKQNNQIIEFNQKKPNDRVNEKQDIRNIQLHQNKSDKAKEQIFQPHQQFSLKMWLLDLTMNLKKDLIIQTIEICIELISNCEIGQLFASYILQIYLKTTENGHLKIISAINKILETGHPIHKLIIVRVINNLDMWYRQELAKNNQSNINNQNNQYFIQDKSSIFIQNYKQVKNGISLPLYCKTLVKMNQHKRAIHLLELELEQQEIASLTIQNPLEIYNYTKKRTQYIYQLYNIYKDVSEDYSKIDVIKMMKNLQLGNYKHPYLQILKITTQHFLNSIKC